MSDRLAAWVREQFAEHAPDAASDPSDPAAAMQLAHAWAALTGHGKEIFGMEMPAELAERETLREECLAILKRWVAVLDAPAKERVRQLMTAYSSQTVK